MDKSCDIGFTSMINKFEANEFYSERQPLGKRNVGRSQPIRLR